MNFSATEIIQKKRDGIILSSDEIQWFITQAVTGEIPDYQTTALLMAVYFQGMNLDETVALTRALLESGEHYDLSEVPGYKVDKHSTGGVGDKVSIILAPLAASCGVVVPMMSGRGLGHSGGTLDKLESLPGFRVNLNFPEFKSTLSRIGCAMIGQSATIVPGDRKLYSLRDVTGTVESIPLIVASILSKKAAEGTQGLIIDLKTGNGAFMKTVAQGKALGKALENVGKKLGLKMKVILTRMDQPLGNTAGNALEMIECIEIMSGGKFLPTQLDSKDLVDLTVDLTAEMVINAKIQTNLAKARSLVRTKLTDGTAWKKFRELVELQSGDLSSLDSPLKMISEETVQTVWNSPKKGFLSQMQTAEIGRILVELGGGRKKASDAVNHSVGFVFHKKLGARLKKDEPLVTVYSTPQTDLLPLQTRFNSALTFSANKRAIPRLIV